MFHKSVEDEVRDSGRLLGRLMTDHFLRQVEILARLQNGDLIRGLILLAILSANVRPFGDDPALSRLYTRAEDGIPDDLRAPVSVNGISASLGIPYETTRRYINRLIDSGEVVRVDDRGVIVTRQTIDDLMERKVLEEGLSGLRRYLGALRRSGFDLNAPASHIP